MSIEGGSYAPAPIMQPPESTAPWMNEDGGMSTFPEGPPAVIDLDAWYADVLAQIRKLSPEYQPENIPLLDIPSQRHFDPSEYETAKHEVNHFAILAGTGNISSFQSISVIPDGNVLGYMSFNGDLGGHFPAVAAGGILSGEGFGGDMLQILRWADHNGIDREVALSNAMKKAKSIINSYDDGVLDKAAEIVAYKRYMAGDEGRLIIKRARIEKFYEENGLDFNIALAIARQGKNFTKNAVPQKEYVPPVIAEKGKTTVIITHPHGFGIAEFEDGELQPEESLFICKCPNKNRHLPGCPYAEKKQKQPKKKKKNDTRDITDGVKIIHLSGTVYTHHSKIIAGDFGSKGRKKSLIEINRQGKVIVFPDQYQPIYEEIA